MREEKFKLANAELLIQKNEDRDLGRPHQYKQCRGTAFVEKPASPSWSLVEYNAKGLIINKERLARSATCCVPLGLNRRGN